MPRTEAQDLIKSSLLQLCMPSAICTSTTSNDMAEEAADAAAAASAGGTTIAACALPAHPAQLSPDAVASLAGAFTGTLLQHYTLWTFVFTQQQQHEQHQHHLMVSSQVDTEQQPTASGNAASAGLQLSPRRACVECMYAPQLGTCACTGPKRVQPGPLSAVLHAVHDQQSSMSDASQGR